MGLFSFKEPSWHMTLSGYRVNGIRNRRFKRLYGVMCRLIEKKVWLVIEKLY